MTAIEKIAYLKGLAEGLGVEADAKEGKLFFSILDILKDLADNIGEMENLEERVDEIEESNAMFFSNLERAMKANFLDWDDDEEDDEDWDEDDDEDEDEDEDEFLTYEIKCPKCGKTIVLDESIVDQSDLRCPDCGAALNNVEELPFM